jgi:hypothetical protein
LKNWDLLQSSLNFSAHFAQICGPICCQRIGNNDVSADASGDALRTFGGELRLHKNNADIITF